MLFGRERISPLPDRTAGNAAPFDGSMVLVEGPISLSVARQMLAFALEQLRATSPTVVMLRDWWEHDGQQFDHRLGDWSSLDEALTSDEALFRSRAHDFAVRVAYYPPSLEWLLRYEISDERECSLDLSITPSSGAAGLTTALSTRWPATARIVEARAYFARSFGG